MDYDRYDALLHYIFKQTQGDAWFRPDANDGIAAGVAIKDDSMEPAEYRIFPYEDIRLEPFEVAVRAMNLVVAVKVRSAVAHAAVGEAGHDDKSVYVDSNTRIQIVETMMMLPHADREQHAAFIRDERVLVVWSDSLEAIIPTCSDFEERLIKLLWRGRPGVGSQVSSASHHNSFAGDSASATQSLVGITSASSNFGGGRNSGRDIEKQGYGAGVVTKRTVTKRTWYGRKYTMEVTEIDGVDIESLGPEKRPAMLYAPVYNGLCMGLSAVCIGDGIKNLLVEFRQDNGYIRFALAAVMPLLFCVSLFFTLQIVQNIAMVVGPVAQYHENTKYYSAVKPRPNKEVDNNLPHITIQMPVYKESLEAVLAPSIASLKKAMQTYARQGGTSTIFVNDDGMQLLSEKERAARLAFYDTHGIGWVARPGHGSGTEDGGAPFLRAGRFKKASNMNYGLSLSRKAERHLIALREKERLETQNNSSAEGGYSYAGSGDHHGEEMQMDIEEKALQMAVEQVYEESGRRHKPWAKGGKACRMGEIILIVDSDTIVPEDCFRDAAREMAECPMVGVIQHESDVMQVSHNYFENGIAYFTRRINKCISFACCNGEVAPFVGHNAFLRWQAVQDASFIDPADKQEKIWSEAHVSEDFDMAMRLQLRGYTIRWATYSLGGFKEGVSLTIDDELNRWQKYSYGCSELLFNPFVRWFTRGPIAKQIHRFIWSNAPFHYKISMLAYMFSYYGIACAITITTMNYFLLGWELPVDDYYIHSFEIWLATTVVFFGSGNVGYTILQYRLGERDLIWGFLENIKWVPFFFFFFGGLSIPLSQAILAHMFSYNITWGATKKEVERSNFFKEIPKILKRFWVQLSISIVLVAGMIILSTSLVPLTWRIDGSSWAVVFPLAIVVSCHILFPIVLNPWLMVFSY